MYFCGNQNQPAYNMDSLYKEVSDLLLYIGIDKNHIGWSARIIILLLSMVISYVTTTVFHHIIIPLVQRATAKTEAKWDDILLSEDVLRKLCRMIPPIVLFLLLPFAFDGMPTMQVIVEKACLIYLVVSTVMLIMSILDALHEITSTHERFGDHSINSIHQMIKLVAGCVGAILIISILINKNAGTILAGLSASAAVLMLIFKDSILGLVAGVQLSVNKMLQEGDWITMSKYGANGYVKDISLTTVKVENFDKSITTIPPYALVSDSFQNWRGMWQSGGRRVMRSIYIDVNSVRFCQPDEVEKYAANGWITEDEAKKPSQVVNLKVFRSYLLHYLKTNPNVNQEMMMMIRQLQPTPEGLPLEIYCFAKESEWTAFEAIQGEIMDHVMAILPRFGLRLYQRPSGNDLCSALQK